MKRVLILLALAPLLHAGIARAQSESDRATATALYRHGLALLLEGKEKNDRAIVEAGCGEFRKSLALYDSTKTLWNLASCEMRVQRYPEALFHLRAYQHREPNSEWREVLPKYIAEAQAAVGTLDIHAPPGARVLLDDVDVGRAPLLAPIAVMPGPHAITAELPTATLRASTTASAGIESRVELREALPQAATPLTPSTNGPAQGASPPPDVFALKPVDEPPFWTTRRYVGLAVVGAGALALVGSDVAAAATVRDRDEAALLSKGLTTSNACNRPSQACLDRESAYAAQSRGQTWSTVLLGAGLASIAVGAALVVWPSASSKERPLALAPAPLPGGGAFLVSGAFQ